MSDGATEDHQSSLAAYANIRKMEKEIKTLQAEMQVENGDKDHFEVEKQHLITWLEFLLQSLIMPPLRSLFVEFCIMICLFSIPLAQRVPSFSSSQLLQSPCSTFLWPNEL